MRIRKLIYDPVRELHQPAMTEEMVLGQIRALLEFNGARVHRVIERIPWGRTKSEGGIPDLFCWWPSRNFAHVPGTCWIEVKRPGGKFRPAQAAWIAQAQADGVIAFKAESVEEMVSEFKKYGIEVRGS